MLDLIVYFSHSSVICCFITASFRANVPHMQKFPKDVSNAEVRVGGNPNILSDPVFAPEKRRNASDDETPSSKGKKEKRLKIG